MADISARVQRVVEEMMGNEALLEMLETEAATEMLNWGIEMGTSLVKKTDDQDDLAANLTILPRLKEVRQAMRSIGNWAAGKYTDASSRVELRDKLLERFRVIFGERMILPSAAEFDALLNQANDKKNTPYQLILKLKELLETKG
ncbi:MAG: hypothetical protein L0287_33635 [Anaerolineae bacterium]|nr:hypothetical protein [Anaerolineae bacterium]MCI0610397.1 hypothetical protein [Anaerolineae bacterium]